jgi:hypothetical protein
MMESPIKDIQAQRDQFGLKFYDWALADALAESLRGFPLLHLVGNSLGMRFLEYVHGRTLGTIEPLCRGLVKLFHPRAVQLSGDRLTQSEAKEVEALRRGEVSSGHRAILKKSELRRALDDQLKQIFPGAEVYWMRGLCDVSVPIEGWSLRTTIDMGGGYSLFSYRQSLQISEALVLAEGISILNWCGIAGQTDWEFGENCDEIAHEFRVVCEHFVSAAPMLLRGIAVKS